MNDVDLVIEDRCQTSPSPRSIAKQIWRRSHPSTDGSQKQAAVLEATPAVATARFPPPAARLVWTSSARLDAGEGADILAVLLAVAVVGLDLATYLGGLRLVAWDHFLILPSLVPGALLAIRRGRRLLAPDRLERRAWVVPLLLLGAVATAAGLWYGTHVPGSATGDPLALGIQATGEELSFRLAWPLALAALLSRPLGWPRAFVVGYLVAGVAFCCTPGHLSQYGGPLGPLPWVAFAGLAAWVAARSGAIVATAAAHAGLDLLAFDTTLGHLPVVVYGAVASAVLVILGAGTISAAWSSGRLAVAA